MRKKRGAAFITRSHKNDEPLSLIKHEKGVAVMGIEPIHVVLMRDNGLARGTATPLLTKTHRYKNIAGGKPNGAFHCRNSRMQRTCF